MGRVRAHTSRGSSDMQGAACGNRVQAWASERGHPSGSPDASTAVLKVAESMSCGMMDGTMVSAIEPKKSALKTGQQTASTAR